MYREICDDIALIVKEFVCALEACDREAVISLIKKNRQLLQKLSVFSGANLETDEIKKICDQAELDGFAAKFSGAGGGDCVVVVSDYG